MSWRESSIMDQRREFIQQMLMREKPFKQLCADFGISEKTGYKWKHRFEEEGEIGLYDQSRAPNTKPNALSEDIIICIVNLKIAHPTWGPKKIQALYCRIKQETVSLSSVKRILDKVHLVKKQRVRKADTDSSRLRRHIQAEQPNDVWAIDFKGWWMSDGEKCIPFNIRDVASRKILAAVLVEKMDSDTCRRIMTDTFRKYGLPKVIRSDNGIPFASSHSILSLTDLSAWWITLGITPDRTKKGTPGQNGSIERMHRDMANEIEGRIPGGRAANQRALDLWVNEYNSVRPNEAIGMKTPDEVYVLSDRKYKGDFDVIEYPPGYIPRKVFSSGEISIDSVRVTISSALRGLTLGLVANGDNTYLVYLADFLLGTADFNSCCFTPFETV